VSLDKTLQGAAEVVCISRARRSVYSYYTARIDLSDFVPQCFCLLRLAQYAGNKVQMDTWMNGN
jgi:hypothetical protein